MIRPGRLAQNRGKQQIRPHFVGKGAQQSYAALPSLLRQAKQASFSWAAKHLGSMFAHDGATSTEVTVRITEARRAWISLGRCWYTAAISLALRRSICIALPLAILLSGLDAFALS
eukprot:4877956-Heterocapsa_arctica.AAC.1